MIINNLYCSCQSFVGKIRESLQPQGVTLGPNCVSFNIVSLEIGHAIGLYHEHQRPDRDRYIEILEENIESSRKASFAVRNDVRTLGYGYDFASIMHYRENEFGINNAVTIVSRQPGIPVGGAQELSPLDAFKVNALYECGKLTD